MASATFEDGPTLSEALRDRTQELHTKAERTGIISEILKKKAGKHSYALFLRNLLPVYQEMELALARRSEQAAFSIFAQPALHRSDKIVADLFELCGDDWQRDLPVLPATETYASSVVSAGQGDAMRLIAHAYVRYFGDLSGGLILKRLLANSLQLAPSALSFYDFPEIVDPDRFKHEMRETIDLQVARVADHEAIIDEGKRVFEHNIAVSLAVQAAVASTASSLEQAASVTPTAH